VISVQRLLRKASYNNVAQPVCEMELEFREADPPYADQRCGHLAGLPGLKAGNHNAE
jgi:hypothetical protein